MVVRKGCGLIRGSEIQNLIKSKKYDGISRASKVLRDFL